MPPRVRNPRQSPRRSVTLSDQLRRIVKQSGRTDHSLATEAGIDPGAFGRFMRAERTWTLDTADRLADLLGIELVIKAKKSRDSFKPRPAHEKEPEASAPGSSVCPDLFTHLEGASMPEERLA